MVEIDGVPVPAQDALTVAQQGIAAATDAQAYVQQALAQPIGQALNDTKAACAAVQKAIKRYTAAVNKSINQAQGNTVDTLANYVRGALDATGLAADAVGKAAATGATPTTSPAPSSLQSLMFAPPGQPACTTPYSIISDWPGVGAFCALLQLQFQCTGSDGHTPGYNLQALPPPGATYGGISETHNWIVGGGSITGIPPSFPSYAAAKQYLAGLLANPPCGGVAPPAPVFWNIYYYCDPCIDPNNVRNWTAGVFNTNPGGKYILFQGAGVNFRTQPEAQAALDSSGTILDNICKFPPNSCPVSPAPAPGPQPAPISPPPPTAGESCIVLRSCTEPSANPCALTDQQITIPTIGSTEFIQAAEAMKLWFVALGRRVISWVKGNSSDFSPPESVAVDTQTGDPDWVSAITTVLSKAILGWSKSGTDKAAKQLGSTIDCWSGLLDNVQGCNVPEVVSLCVARAVIEILSHFRFGWDLIIWGTFDLTVHIDPLIKVLDYLIADSCPAELPAVGDTIEAWLKGGMDDDTATAFMRFAGANPDVWNTVIQSRRERTTPEQAINLGRRAGLSDETIAEVLRTYGFINATEAADFIEAYDELPNISDVLHFLQRNVFDSEYVADYGLMEGFDTRFWPRYGQGLRAIGVMEQTAKDHYAAHWINPSIGQLAEMAQRLRPGRVDQSVQFQWQDFLRVLAEQDVAPYFRARLQAISYRTLPIRQLTQLVVTRQITEDELSERWQDIGYSPADSKLLARALMIQGNRQRATQQRGFTPAVVAKLWPAGKISYAEAVANLAPQGLEQTDVDTLLEVAEREAQAALYQKNTLASIREYASLATKAFADGVVSAVDAQAALTKAGFSPEAASVEIQTTTLRVKMTRIDQARNAIRRSFLRGEVNASEAESALALIGVQPDSIVASISLWQMQLTIPRKAAATGQIRKWAEEGLISLAAAETRFHNLGWRPEDITLMIAEINQTIKSAELRAQQRTDKALAQASARAAAAQLQIQKAYCRKYSPSKLKLWFSERIIDESGITAKLQQCGYDSEYINNFIDEATVARDKKDEQAAKKGPTGIEYTGPGAITS